MSLMDWFKPAASWREKATALAAKRAETVASRESLEQDAATRALAAGLDDKDIGRIEREIQELAARERWLERALAEAEAKASAEEAAAEAERRRQEAEAKARRIAELRTARERAVAVAERETEAAGQAWAEVGRLGVELAAEIGSEHARRTLHPHALAERLTITLWGRVKGWLHYQINTLSPDAKLSPSEKESAIVAGLLDKPGGDGGDEREAA